MLTLAKLKYVNGITKIQQKYLWLTDISIHGAVFMFLFMDLH